MEKTDHQLVYESLKGDDNAFKELLNRHLKHVYNFIYRLCGNAEESKDITQDTFLKVWKNLKKYNPDFSFNTWIISIARNTTIDWLRKKRPLMFSDFDKDDEIKDFKDTIQDTEPLQDELFEREETKKKMEEILMQISIQKRTILLMHINEHMTFEEMAQILKKPMNTIKSQYRRALIELKKILDSAPK